MSSNPTTPTDLYADGGGVSSQVYVGKRPWHGIGHELPGGVSCYDAIEAHPVLGSPIVACPTMVGAPDGTLMDWPEVMAHVRTFDNRIVGRGSPRYAIMQHVDLADFADRIADRYGCTFEIAGLLSGGSTFVMQAAMGGDVEIGKLPDGRPDTVRGYLTISTTHDGSRPTQIGFAMIRAECANMTALALSQAKKGKNFWSIPHVGDQDAKMRVVEKALGVARTAWHGFVDFARAAAQTPMDVEQFDAFALVLLPDRDVEDTNSNSTQRTNRRHMWRGLFESGIGNGGATAWDAYNAITEWSNYRLPLRGVEGDEATAARVEQALFGRSATLAAQAEIELRAFVYRLD